MSAPRYFQGKSVTGLVFASAARTFKEVCDILRVAPALPFTHAAFLALDEKQRNEAKQVPFFVPATFKDSPSKRDYAHALECNLLFLDIDPEKRKVDGKWIETGRYPAAPFVKDPQLIKDALRGFNFLAHLTASSTPEKPRMRIVVDAQGIPITEYPKAVATIGALLGLPNITRESLVSVQPMFLPTLFHDSPDDFSPVLTLNLDGRPFVLSDISDSLDSYHGSNGANGSSPHGANGSSEHDSSADGLEFLKAPVPEISLAVTKEALSAIDPDISYHEWLDMAAALRHQFSPHKDEEAYTLFDEWSAGGSKYQGTDETLAKWRSLKPSPNGRLPITIRSLLRKATEHGWDDSRVKENCIAELMRWTEMVSDSVSLMEKGIRRILAMPISSAMQEDMLISTLCQQAKKRFSFSISSTTVRKDLNRIKAEIRAHSLIKKKSDIPSWAKDVCYIIGADEFFRYRTGEKIKPPAFNAAYGRYLLPTEKQLQEQNIPITPASASTPMVLPSHYVLHNLKIPTAQDYAYDPSQPLEKFFALTPGGNLYLNTYNPTYPLPDPTRAKEAGALIQRHLRHLIAEPENQRIMLDFMAFQVQAPGRKVRWAPMIQSVEGAGKTFLAEVMKAILGAEHVKTIDGASIKSGWNEWSVGKQIIVLEEVKVSGTNKHEIMNSLKPLITNNTISVNQRFRDNREVANISNYILFSNHHDALALTPGDRRYFVIKSPLQTKQQVLDLGEDYFPPMYAMLRDHPGAFRSFFLDWEISPDFRPDGHAPRTKYVQDMVNDSANDLTATVRRLLLEGDVPMVQYDIVSANELRKLLINEEGFTKITSQSIAQVLREEGLHQAGRHLIGDDRHYIWVRAGITEDEAVATLADRVKRNLKNLCMDLLF